MFKIQMTNSSLLQLSKQSEMDKVNFICLLTLALSVTSTFSQKNQGYRNRYNLINCGCEKKIIFMYFEKRYLINRYLSRFFDCRVHPNLSATLATDKKLPLSYHLTKVQQSAINHSTNKGLRDLFYVTKIRAVPWSSNKIIPISIALKKMTT